MQIDKTPECLRELTYLGIYIRYCTLCCMVSEKFRLRSLAPFVTEVCTVVVMPEHVVFHVRKDNR